MPSSTSGSELDLVAAAKQQRAAAGGRSPAAAASKAARPRAAAVPSPTAAATTAITPAADSDSDSEPFDLVAAAKKSSTNKAAAQASHGRHACSPHAAVLVAPAPAPALKPRATPPPPQGSGSGSGSESDEVDMVALAHRQRSRTPAAPVAQAAPASDRAMPAAASPSAPATGRSRGLSQAPRQLRDTVTASMEQPLADVAGPGPAHQLPQQPQHQAPTLLDLAAGPLPQLPSETSSPAAALAATQQPAPQLAPAATTPPAAAPLLSELGGVLGDLKATLRADINRLEAGWSTRWQEQADSTAELRGRLDALHASSSSQAQEVQGRLQASAKHALALQGELEQQRSRLQAVECAQEQQAAAAAAASPAKDIEGCTAAPVLAAVPALASPPPPPPPAAPAADLPGGMPAVEAIMRRLALLEDRVGQQLQHMEAACAGSGSPRSAPISPLKPGRWGEAERAFAPPSGRASPAGHHRQPRAAQAAAVAAAAVYGTTTSQASEVSIGSDTGYGAAAATHGWHAYKCAPGSPQKLAAGVVRPASAGPGSGGCGRRSRPAVDAQVAETHAIIAGIQSQIAAIKGSLAHTSVELDARRQEAGGVASRLDRLEQSNRYMTSVEAANLTSATALERRVRSLEGQVAAVARETAEGGLVARQAHAAVTALEWRVDKSSDATIGTIKVLESRQDKLRSKLHSTATAATLADAKAATLAAEVARLQRKVHGSGCSAKAGFSVY